MDRTGNRLRFNGCQDTLTPRLVHRADVTAGDVNDDQRPSRKVQSQPRNQSTQDRKSALMEVVVLGREGPTSDPRPRPAAHSCAHLRGILHARH